MAAMTTVLSGFQNNGNKRTFMLVGHTAVKPALVLQQRKVPQGKDTVLEDEISVLLSTVNADGERLPNRVMYSIKFRRPIDGVVGERTSALSILRDILNGDEILDVIDKQAWLS